MSKKKISPNKIHPLPVPVTTDLLERLDLCPPFAAYYASHIGRGKRLTVDQLAVDAGLGRRAFLRVSARTTWAGVRCESMVKFCRACGIDPLNSGHIMEQLALEMQSPNALAAWDGHLRNKMIRNFNALATKVAVEKIRAA